MRPSRPLLAARHSPTLAADHNPPHAGPTSPHLHPMLPADHSPVLATRHARSDPGHATPLLAARGLLLAACCFLLTGCGVNRPVKLGLSAPFEGRYRDLGYEVLYAVRLAVRERNEARGIGGRYPVELVALNDFNDPGEALIQARKMAADPDVLAVLGGWSPEAAAAAGPEYERLGLTFVAPAPEWSDAGYPPPSPDGAPARESAFVEGYQALSGGVPPGAAAVWAYVEANRILDAFAAAAGRTMPTRDGVLSAIKQP